MSTESPIVMYTSPLCGYCQRAKTLLHRKGVAYEDINLLQEPDRWNEMMNLSGRDTVPQIFIGQHHIGGYDDMAALEMDGKLNPLLGIA